MNILVTGGAGFIASHIVNSYIQNGHHVVVIDDLSTGQRQHLDPKAIFYEMDIRDDKIEEILKTEKIELINHHAAQMSVQASVKDPVFDANSNIIGTLLLIQKAVELRIKKFIFASTGGALYENLGLYPSMEEHSCKPDSPYGISKMCVENYLDYYRENSELEPLIFRYSNIFGPRQNPLGEAGVVAIFCNGLKNEDPLVINGDGDQTRDFLFIEDVVKANLIGLSPDCSGTYNIGTGKEVTINSITDSLIKLSGRDVIPQHGPKKSGEQRRSVIDSKKFQNKYNWRVESSLEDGLQKTLKYFSDDKK
ncbi:MAG: NAD-dependent epimerase/dehydratase family protein [Nitrospinales bacterium]